MDVLQYLTEYVNEWRSSNNITYSGKLETSDYREPLKIDSQS